MRSSRRTTHRRRLRIECLESRQLLTVQAGDVFAASINPSESNFGDEFVNFPDRMGEDPVAGNGALQGWVTIGFSEVTSEMQRFLQSQFPVLPPGIDLVEFRLDYSSNGTEGHLQWGSGAQYRVQRNQVFANPIPQEGTLSNRGVMDRNTGNVLYVQVDAVARNSLIARVNRLNRIPFGFPNSYPPQPQPPTVQSLFENLSPPLDVLTDPQEILRRVASPSAGTTESDIKVFSYGQFHLDEDGDPVSFEFHGETIVPAFLLPSSEPSVPPFGNPPPFAFGPQDEFYFANPTSYWRDPGRTFLEDLDSNGIRVSTFPPDPVLFHPHFDLVTDRLSKLNRLTRQSPASAPLALAGASLVTADETLFLIGGRTENGDENRGMYRFDMATNQWSPLHPAEGQTPATSFAHAAAVEGTIYVAGGSTNLGQTVVGDLHAYHVADNRWQALPRMPVPVHSAAVGSDGRRLYVVGGFDERNVPISSVQIFEIEKSQWSLGNPLPFNEGRAASAGTMVGPHLYVIGGTTSPLGNGASHADHKVLAYDTQFDVWSELPRLVEPVVYASAGFIDDQVIVSGGRPSTSGPATTHDQVLRISANEWLRAASSPLPSSEAASAVSNKQMFIVGGHAEPYERLPENPGRIVSIARAVSPSSAWRVSDDQPFVLSVVSAADMSPRVAGNSRAVVFGYNLIGARGATEVEINGVKSDLVLPLMIDQPDSGPLVPDRLYIHVPELVSAKPAQTHFELTVRVDGQESSTRIPAFQGNAPSLFVYDFLVAQERVFFDDAQAYAHDAAGNLNYAAQPARPGGTVTLYATGVSSAAEPVNLTAEINGIRTPVVHVGPDPGGQAGIVTVTIHIPPNVAPSNNALVTIESDGQRSNRAAIAVYPESHVPFPKTPISAVEGRAWIVGMSPAVEARRVGDSNGDGVFNQLDVNHVLQSGKYLSGEAATFEEGDWNGDGYFDQRDIIKAWQEGQYEPSTRSSVSNSLAALGTSKPSMLKEVDMVDAVHAWDDRSALVLKLRYSSKPDALARKTDVDSVTDASDGDFPRKTTPAHHQNALARV